jgi:hypothetical protein
MAVSLDVLAQVCDEFLVELRSGVHSSVVTLRFGHPFNLFCHTEISLVQDTLPQAAHPYRQG